MISFKQFLQFALPTILLTCNLNALYGQQGLFAEYYNDIELKSHVLTRLEQRPQLNLYLKSPAPGVNREYFSVRWKGKLTAPHTGEYTFYVKADDGIRIWVDGKKLIDAWVDQEVASYKGSIFLEGGKQYDLKIEYYNSILHAILSVMWEDPADAYTLMGVTLFHPDSELPSTVFTADTISRKIYSDNVPSVIPAPDKPVTPTIAAKPPKEIKKNTIKPALAQPIAVNKTIELNSVHFEQTKYELLEDSHAELDNIVTHLKTYPALKIKIIGHTDYAGDSTANQILSQQRAEAVANYFKLKGITPARISVLGTGSSKPRIVHDKAHYRKENRRVEFVLIEE